MLNIHARYESEHARFNVEKPGGFQVVTDPEFTAICGFTDGSLEVNIGSDDVSDLIELRDELTRAIDAHESGELDDDGVYIFGEPANTGGDA